MKLLVTKVRLELKTQTFFLSDVLKIPPSWTCWTHASAFLYIIPLEPQANMPAHFEHLETPTHFHLTYSSLLRLSLT